MCTDVGNDTTTPAPSQQQHQGSEDSLFIMFPLTFCFLLQLHSNQDLNSDFLVWMQQTENMSVLFENQNPDSFVLQN